MAEPNQELLSQSGVYAARLEMMARHASLLAASVLEIGAFDRPTFNPEPGRSFFLDYLSQEELRHKGAQIGRHIDKIPPMDFVATTNLLSKEVDRQFDLVVGNHVIEHVPNLLEWLVELAKIVKDDGHVFLSVPDRRFTFDYLRRETTLAEVLATYSEGCKKPDFWKIFEVRLLERPQVVGAIGWHQDVLAETLKSGGRSPREALQAAKREGQQPYVDIHCSVFTHASFIALIDALTMLDVSPFEIAEIKDVVPGTLEFHVMLRKNPAFDVATLDRLVSELLPAA